MNLPKVQAYRTVPVHLVDESGQMVSGFLWPMVVWHVKPGVKVSVAIMRSCELFQRETNHEAQIALVHEIPQGAEEGIDVRGVTLICQEWVEPGFVLVGRPEDRINLTVGDV